LIKYKLLGNDLKKVYKQMAKKEIITDYWVKDLLKEADIKLDPQGSSILEIDNALKTASKNGKGNVGFPEFVGVVKDFLIVIENKANLSKHSKLDDKKLISLDPKDVVDYAINGAFFYGKHLVKNTSYKKVLAFGISGNEKKHKISPIFIDETEYYRELQDVESFISFNTKNIDEYYTREILKEETNEEKETAEILRDASSLHEDLRNYGNLKDVDKPLIVSGILLALRESEFKNFSIDDLTGDDIKTDGQKIYDAILSNLTRANVSPEVKKDKILSQFSLIKDTKVLNEINPKLNKTPLKHYTDFLNDKIYKSIKYTKSSEDYLGRFYGEFMSYSGGDGQTLGIVLTPKHITDLFCNLADLNTNDVVIDPCCGTGGFLVSSMHYMLEKLEEERITNNIQESRIKQQQTNIKQKQLLGFELQPYMFTIATTNMILRGDGKSNLINDDFIAQNTSKLQLSQSTVGMINPPYSQGSKQNPDLYEINFIKHLLESLTTGGRCIAIVPQSSMTGKTKEEAEIKDEILKRHTLEGVITLNKDTFYGVGTMPCIVIFTAGIPHPDYKECKFIDFREDGFRVSPHIGLVETEQAKDKKQHLLDVWFDRIETDTKFCVETKVESSDEWLHSFYYFNDEIPTESDFEKTIGDFLTFEFSMIMNDREYLFKEDNK
jgi:type I restriction-modification system DNA methylase subunit